MYTPIHITTYTYVYPKTPKPINTYYTHKANSSLGTSHVFPLLGNLSPPELHLAGSFSSLRPQLKPHLCRDADSDLHT